MRLYDIIKKKRDGLELSSGEINFVIKAYTKGDLPEYQMSALLMAIYFQGMSDKETIDLTKAMIDSGETINLEGIGGIKVDKHSTGGVGDKTTLVLGPMVAAMGLPFVKMSGRGLGHTGGTLDKLEAIKGFKVDLKAEDFIDIVNKINLSICSQTGNIVPADKKIYSLRDVTATVESLPLIASSIMSKKLAIGSDAIILDVKVGKGAFMKNVDDAIDLSRIMVDIGQSFNKETIALITNMDQPLGLAIGNSLEVIESIESLKGNGPKDLVELSLELGSRLLSLGKGISNTEEAKNLLMNTIKTGKALEKFKEMVFSQGGDISYIEDTRNFKRANYEFEVKSENKGYVHEINAESVGLASLRLGAGRSDLDSLIDLSVGIVLNKKIGDKVDKGETIARVYANDLLIGEEVSKELLTIISIKDSKKQAPKLIYAMIDKDKIVRY